MVTIYRFDVITVVKNKYFILAAAMLLCTGIFTGVRFNLSAGLGVHLNSPYTTGFMTGMLSLLVIFIGTITAYQLLFKEWDNRFEGLLFTTPLTKIHFFSGRLIATFTITFACFVLIIIGFALGHLLRTGQNIDPAFHLSYYVYPLVIFGIVNTLFICSVQAMLAWLGRSKLLVAAGGLFIYILYMVSLLFSNSPFMANTSPQSLEAQNISALTDPFGLSAYFAASSRFTPLQRNEQLVPLSGILLANRLLVLCASIILIYISYKRLNVHFVTKKANAHKKKPAYHSPQSAVQSPGLLHVETQLNKVAGFQSLISFFKNDLKYLFRNVPLVITTIFFIFFLSMEMYAEIEKGIRLPQKFASSGLMAEAINENLHLLLILASVYFINDIFWRNKEHRFDPLEKTTYYAFLKNAGHGLTAITLQLFFTMVMMVLGILFQLFYGYAKFDVAAYGGILVFTTIPASLFGLLAVVINARFRRKYLALAASLVAALIFGTSLGKLILPNTVFRIFSGYSGPYSDFAGYGAYLSLFLTRALFGSLLLGLVALLIRIFASRKGARSYIFAAVPTAIAAFATFLSLSKNYQPDLKSLAIDSAILYEKKYKHYLLMPQPAITDVDAEVELFPKESSYSIHGHYRIKNKNSKPVETILFSFADNFEISSAHYQSNKEKIVIKDAITEVRLASPMAPGDTASFYFHIKFKSNPINGHDPFNAIVSNGSFMRISRYYPRIGYQVEKEWSEKSERAKRGLLTKDSGRNAEDSFRTVPDFVNLNMIISTEAEQTAVGTGHLISSWRKGNRNFYHYSPQQLIPFRFAISSAVYQKRVDKLRGIDIIVMYHPSHIENVDHLIKNAKLTLDYCIDNFGPYPFRSITFAEISAFTSGFAATAYPGAIFMTEQTAFHANLATDIRQDVINELAGHELSHLWWGGNQIVPDPREGSAMLTETLAMYTEMMLYKKMYGTGQMTERIKMHQQIYEAAKGFSNNEPLFRVKGDNTHISYSKGAMVMTTLASMLGEKKLNAALKNFLQQWSFPNNMPASTDLINEILKVSDTTQHQKILDLFTK